MPTTKLPKPLVITGFEQGIGDTPLTSFADMRNVTVDKPQGAVKVSYQLQRSTMVKKTITFTADSSTDKLTLTGSDGVIKTGDSFTVSNTGGSLPSGLSASTNYFAIRVDATTIRVATSYANSKTNTYIDITSNGSGTNSLVQNLPRKITFWDYDKVSGYTYGLDAAGKLWCDYGTFSKAVGNTMTFYLVPGNTLTSTNSNGLIIWKGYAFVFRNTIIDVLQLSTVDNTSPTWTNSWKTGLFNTGNQPNHWAIVASNDRVYFINGYGSTLDKNYVGSIQESTVFNPSDSATYVFNATAIDLPDRPTCLEELGGYLMIGTSNYRVYPWDKYSASFDRPIRFPEKTIYSLKTANNTLYCLVGQAGSLYSTDGTNTTLVKKLSETIVNAYYTAGNLGSTNYTTFVQGKIAFVDSELYFPLVCFNESFICSFNVNTNALLIRNVMSIGYGGYANRVLPGSLMENLGTDMSYFVGWEYDSYGVDSAIDTLYYSYFNTHAALSTPDNYWAYVITPQYKVGTYHSKKTFSNIEIVFTDLLTTGQGARLSWRENLSDSWTTIATIDFATYGAVKSYNTNFGATVEDIQFKIELTSGVGQDSGGYGTGTPGIKEISVSSI